MRGARIDAGTAADLRPAVESPIQKNECADFRQTD